MHRILELHIDADVRALVSENERPYEDVLKKHGHDKMTDITSPLMSSSPLEIYNRIDWTTRSAESVILAATMISEVLSAPLEIRTGHNIAWEAPPVVPAICVASESTIGFRAGDGFFFVEEETPHPALSLLIAVIKYGAVMGDTSCCDCKICFEHPDRLSQLSPLYRILHSAQS